MEEGEVESSFGGTEVWSPEQKHRRPSRPEQRKDEASRFCSCIKLELAIVEILKRTSGFLGSNLSSSHLFLHLLDIKSPSKLHIKQKLGIFTC